MSTSQPGAASVSRHATSSSVPVGVGRSLSVHRVDYLLLVDSYSKWLCAVRLRSTTASAVIAELDRLFSDFGTPEEFESDNGTQLECAEIRAFFARQRIRHVTSSPEYAHSNGLVERHIQTVKRTLLKMFRDGKTLWEALAAIRSTPVSSTLPSPAVLLQGRNLRGSLPFLPERLQPHLVPARSVIDQLRQRQATASFQQGRSPTVRGSALVIGLRVRTLVSGNWKPGVVESVCGVPNSYVIRLEDGRAFHRTRADINVDNARPAVRMRHAPPIPILPPLAGLPAPDRVVPRPATPVELPPPPPFRAATPPPAPISPRPDQALQPCPAVRPQPTPSRPQPPRDYPPPTPARRPPAHDGQTPSARLALPEPPDDQAIPPVATRLPGTTRSGRSYWKR